MFKGCGLKGHFGDFWGVGFMKFNSIGKSCSLFRSTGEADIEIGISSASLSAGRSLNSQCNKIF